MKIDVTVIYSAVQKFENLGFKIEFKTLKQIKDILNLIICYADNIVCEEKNRILQKHFH